MIRYSLRCAEGHGFDSWFRDSAAYDALAAAGRVACAICGETRVEKALMAPAVGRRERDEPASAAPVTTADNVSATVPTSAPAERPAPMLSGPPGPTERALAKLRRFLAEKADHVGREFADEARRIHNGEAEERTIWGEATPEEAQALYDEGVPVAPLPFIARRDD